MEKGLIHTIINTDLKYLMPMYVPQECMVPLLPNSPQICSYTMDVLFNGLLAELPTSLDSFKLVPQVIMDSRYSGGLKTYFQVVTIPNGPIIINFI